MAEQPCQHGNYPSDEDDHCWFHCIDSVPDDWYIYCLECGHSWGEAALVEAYNADAERHGVPHTPLENIFFCPLCLHDF